MNSFHAVSYTHLDVYKRQGIRNKRIEINCLAFANDFAVLSEHLTSAVTQVNFLEDIANRTGLRISVKKKQISHEH